MSIEKNLHEVKDKLTKDQNLLVSAFKLETFYKKYKYYIFLIVAIVLAFGAYKGFVTYKEHSINEQAHAVLNSLYDKGITDSQRQELEAELANIKPTLYDFYRYTQLQQLSPIQLKTDENLAILEQLSHSQNPLIAALAGYQHASFTENLAALENFRSDVAPVLRDRARFQAAYLYLQNDNAPKAHEILKTIQFDGNNRAVSDVAALLAHYGVAKDESKATSSDLAK